MPYLCIHAWTQKMQTFTWYCLVFISFEYSTGQQLFLLRYFRPLESSLHDFYNNFLYLLYLIEFTEVLFFNVILMSIFVAQCDWKLRCYGCYKCVIVAISNVVWREQLNKDNRLWRRWQVLMTMFSFNLCVTTYLLMDYRLQIVDILFLWYWTK